MSNVESRVQQCFHTIFPDLSSEEVQNAALDQTPQWDSMSTVMLITVMEEEFSFAIDPMDFDRLTSFRSIVSYVKDTTQVAVSDSDNSKI